MSNVGVPRLHDRVLEVKIQANYLSSIMEGAKTVEGRVADGEYVKVAAGDVIKLVAVETGASALCRVLEVTHHGSFREMLAHHGFKACLPSSPSLDDALATYESFPRYPERAQASGVLGIVLSPYVSGMTTNVS